MRNVDINHFDVKGLIDYVCNAAVVVPVAIGAILLIGDLMRFGG